MKNILIVFAVLVMASVANATLSLSVDGITGVPGSQITLLPSEFAVIDVGSFNEKAVWTNLIVFEGRDFKGDAIGAVDLSGMSIIALGIDELIIDVSDVPVFRAFVEGLGYEPWAITYSELVHISGTPMDIPNGVMIDGIKLHCEGMGDVIVSLLDGADGRLLDQVIIHQIPEPITFALLGLGGLMLRRRDGERCYRRCVR